MFDRLFKNIGKQVKTLAISVYITGLALGVIGDIIFFFVFLHTNDINNLWIGPLVLIGAVAVASAYGTLLYAFGELVDKVCDNEKNTAELVRLLRDKETAAAPSSPEEKKETTPKVTKKDVINTAKTVPARPVPKKEVFPEHEDDTYLPGKAYYNGDVVKFGGKWYACICEGTSSTIWNPSQNPKHWVETDESKM